MYRPLRCPAILEAIERLHLITRDICVDFAYTPRWFGEGTGVEGKKIGRAACGLSDSPTPRLKLHPWDCGVSFFLGGLMIDEQESVCGIRCPDGPHEFEQSRLSTRVLVVYNSNRLWRPTSPQAIPPRSTMCLPKLEAVTLATMLNRRALRDLREKAAHPVPSIEWAVVARGKLGFHVVEVTADMRYGWRPETPFDIPDGTIGPDQLMNRSDAQRSVRVFNTQQIQAGPSPSYWALPVKELTEADLVDWSVEETAA